jgi:4-coumarate--CoA ligase
MLSSLVPRVDNDIYLGILPFYHIYDEITQKHTTHMIIRRAVNLLHFALKNGSSVAIMQRFDPVQFCANIERYIIQRALVVPPVLVVLARHPGTWNAGI